MPEPITELTVNALNGEMYNLFRRYLEKRKVIWTDTRDKWGVLLSVHLTFPPDTTYKQISQTYVYDTDSYTRHYIYLRGEFLLYWNVHKSTQLNHISIPYAYL